MRCSEFHLQYRRTEHVREVGSRVFNGGSVNKNTKFYSAVKYDYNLRCTSATYDTVKLPKHVTHVKK